MTDKELVQNLVNLWYETRTWAEELIKRTFDIEHAHEIPHKELNEVYVFPGTSWHYTCYRGIINIYKYITDCVQTEEVGGIEFDFNKPDPDADDLYDFLRRQYNAENVDCELYHDLTFDYERLEMVCRRIGVGDKVRKPALEEVRLTAERVLDQYFGDSELSQNKRMLNYFIAGAVITLFEMNPDTEHSTSTEVARFSYDENSKEWTLYCINKPETLEDVGLIHEGKFPTWKIYEEVRPSFDLHDLVLEVLNDPNGVFWGKD